jgi:hypothetical protein
MRDPESHVRKEDRVAVGRERADVEHDDHGPYDAANERPIDLGDRVGVDDGSFGNGAERYRTVGDVFEQEFGRQILDDDGRRLCLRVGRPKREHDAPWKLVAIHQGK